MNEFYFQIDVTDEQVDYANRIVDFSILNHPVTDIFANDPQGKERQREFRFTGSLGEIVFADTYKLTRPTRAFGAIDGQDYGMDFNLTINGKDISFDIKAMGRKNNNFRENYVLNLPKYQMEKDMVITDCYFCISIHKEFSKYIASFIGYIEKDLVYKGKVGILYKAGTRRIKDDGGSFIFQRDTYEVDFKDIEYFITNTNSQYIFFDWDESDMKGCISDFLEEEKDENGDTEFTKEELESVFNGDNIEYKDGREDTTEFWAVCYFKDQDIYIRLDGEYDSYGNYEHEYNKGITQVRPKEIVKTVYE